jgi:hypothetical protein
MCDVLLLLGVNLTAVKYISYHIKYSRYSRTSIHERPCSRTIRFTNKFSEKKSRMTNGVSDYEHASWQQRQTECVSCWLTNLVSVYEHFGSRTASRKELSSWTEVPLYLFLLESESTPEPYCGRKDYVNEKFQWHHRESTPWPSGL